jgi:hypothetical protein
MTPSQTPFHSLLQLSGIKKVYFIDDYIETEIDIDSILTLVADLIIKEKTDVLVTKLEGIVDLSKAPQDEIVNILRSFIDKENSVAKPLAEIINTLSDNDFLKESKVTSKIVTLFPVAEGVHPTKWDSVKKKLAQDLNEGRVLILFDQDLSKAKGFETRKGIDLIVELKKEPFFNQINCVLISHDIKEPKDELLTRKTLIDGLQLKEADFFPLSKKRLEIEDHFFDGIKKALINGFFENIKEQTVALIDHSYNKAIEGIKAFDTYDFDETVLQTSLKEGVWAPDTIVRICDIIFERELKKQMVETDYGRRINGQLKESQKFSEIRFNTNNLPPYSDKLVLRHDETFDHGSIINALRKPLENGDIFELGKDTYILVSQACDTMVRGAGKKKGARNAKTATLLKINERPIKDAKNKKDNQYILPYYNGTNIGLVEFTDFLIVDIDFLDLCVLNNKGYCKINITESAQKTKSYLSQTWENRFDLLVQKIKPYLDKIKRIRRQIRSRHSKFLIKKVIKLKPSNKLKMIARSNSIINISIEKELYPKIILASSTGIENPVKVSNDGTIDFVFRRVGKFRDNGASYLLDRYTKHLSRIAELHDFAS